MKVAIIGAGPAGLYLAILLRRANIASSLTVYERGGPDDVTGFGVVFSDTALDFLKREDPQTHDLIAYEMQSWRNIAINHNDQQIIIDGVGFSAIGRLQLLKLLQQRAAAEGVDIHYHQPIEQLSTLADHDLIVGADGVGSIVRRSDEKGFASQYDALQNHFIWYGANISFDMLSQSFIKTDKGVFNAHHYRYAPGLSTFIIEIDAATYNAYGFAEMAAADTKAICQKVFADILGGGQLIDNNSYWRQFPLIRNDNWFSGNKVLIGDALRTAHFSIGSGTRLAMEDAISLAKALADHPENLPTALSHFQSERQPVVDKLVAAATRSGRWYDEFAKHMQLDAYDFAYHYIGRSGRVDETRLEQMAPNFMASWRQHKKN